MGTLKTRTGDADDDRRDKSGRVETSEEWILDHMITDSYKCIGIVYYQTVGKKEEFLRL